MTGGWGLAPNDDMARYCYSRALEAAGDRVHAREELERVVAARFLPAIVRASALVDYAQTIARAGDRARALAIYRDAARGSGFFDFFDTLCLTSEGLNHNLHLV